MSTSDDKLKEEVVIEESAASLTNEWMIVDGNSSSSAELPLNEKSATSTPFTTNEGVVGVDVEESSASDIFDGTSATTTTMTKAKDSDDDEDASEVKGDEVDGVNSRLSLGERSLERESEILLGQSEDANSGFDRRPSAATNSGLLDRQMLDANSGLECQPVDEAANSGFGLRPVEDSSLTSVDADETRLQSRSRSQSQSPPLLVNESTSVVGSMVCWTTDLFIFIYIYLYL